MAGDDKEPPTRPRAPARHGILRRLACIGFTATLSALVDADSLNFAILATLAFLILQLVVGRSARYSTVLILSLTLYSVSAYAVLVINGERFAPFPLSSTIVDTTVGDLRTVLICFLVTELLFGLDLVDRRVRAAGHAVRTLVAVPKLRELDAILSVALLTVGCYDFVQLLRIGFGNVLGSERRQYATDLLLGGNHNVQAICIASTVYLLARWVLITRSPTMVAVVACAWIPFVISGSRKELIVVGCICVVLLGPALSQRARLTIAAGGVGMFFLPTLYTRDLMSSIHEFALPQYMHFAIQMGLVPHDISGTFVERAQFLLPSFLRITDIETFGQAFYDLRITNVGLGASPFGEATLNNFFGSPTASFVIVWIASLGIALVCSRRLPTVTVVLYSLLVVYGRSDFWTMMFYVVTIAAIIEVFLRLQVEHAPAAIDE